MEGLTEGRMVHFVLPNGDHRPAIVVKVWPNEFTNDDGTTEPGVNLQVFTDGSNDLYAYPAPTYSEETRNDIRRGIHWETSIRFDGQTKAPRTCHWIERA